MRNFKLGKSGIVESNVHYKLEINYVKCLGDTIKEKNAYIYHKVRKILNWLKSELCCSDEDMFIIENKDSLVTIGLINFVTDEDRCPCKINENLDFLGVITNMWGEDDGYVYYSDLVNKNEIWVIGIGKVGTGRGIIKINNKPE